MCGQWWEGIRHVCVLGVSGCVWEGLIVTGSAPVCAHIRPHISLRPTAGAPPPGSGFIEKKGLRDGLMGLGGSWASKCGSGVG